ncbi:hypothetical protein ACOSQ3_002532 [Xanthoceras sorbifolium]
MGKNSLCEMKCRVREMIEENALHGTTGKPCYVEESERNNGGCGHRAWRWRNLDLLNNFDCAWLSCHLGKQSRDRDICSFKKNGY